MSQEIGILRTQGFGCFSFLRPVFVACVEDARIAGASIGHNVVGLRDEVSAQHQDRLGFVPAEGSKAASRSCLERLMGLEGHLCETPHLSAASWCEGLATGIAVLISRAFSMP